MDENGWHVVQHGSNGCISYPEMDNAWMKRLHVDIWRSIKITHRDMLTPVDFWKWKKCFSSILIDPSFKKNTNETNLSVSFS